LASGSPSGLRDAAAVISVRSPVIFSVHGIDEGDALALATRAAASYAYRGRQALFWNPTFGAREVLDRYLPGAPLRPFDRRGLLQVDGFFMGANVSLVATQFSDERATRIRELRFTRTVLRATKRSTLLFITGIAQREPGFADLGFAPVASDRGVVVGAREFGARATILRV
jgi:hypothetical protein